MKELSTESQKKSILDWLSEGNTITSLQALHMFGCMRLASRINDHINDVYTIKSMVWETSLNRAAYRIEAIDGIEDDPYWYAAEMLYYVEPKEETAEEKINQLESKIKP